MKKAKDTLSNFVYLFRMMKSCSSHIFYLLLVQIPIKVLMPFLGILLSKLVVQILMESGDLRRRADTGGNA